MKNKKPKLWEQKDIVPFLLAIAKGADVNEKYRGKQQAYMGKRIVTCYFHDLYCGSGGFWASQSSHKRYQTTLKKFKALALLGADMSEIISEDHSKEYKKLLYSLSEELADIALILSCKSVRKDLSGYRLVLLKNLQQLLSSTDQVISNAGILDSPEVTAEPYEVTAYGYDSTITNAIEHLTLLAALLQSDNEKKEINGWRREMLDALHQMLRSATQMISSSGLTNTLGDVPDPYKTREIYEDAINKECSASGLTNQLSEEDLEFLRHVSETLQLELDELDSDTGIPDDEEP